ncbi:MAG: sugar phosphate nucleotidyltransferase [Pseudomonadota bacterium]
MIVYPVLMVGGAGTRLWPVSRRAKPKQFQNLIEPDRSLFQETVTRMGDSVPGIEIGRPVIIGGADYLGLIEEQLREVGVEPAAIVLEPEPKNTAAVAGVAARIVEQLPGEGLCLLMPSDHHVPDADSFRSAVASGAPAAKGGAIVTFGINMTRPESGFGHIEPGEQIDEHARRVASFIEKPQPPLDQELFDGGRHAWNAGIFLFSPQSMIAEMETHCPDILNAVDASLAGGLPSNGTIHLNPTAFAACPSEPIDIAVMQVTSHAAMVGPVECGWSDIGGWLALAEMTTEPTSSPDIVSVDSDTSHIRTDGSVFVAGLGLEDMIVIAHEGSVLVMPKHRAQDVKQVISELKDRSLDHKL